MTDTDYLQPLTLKGDIITLKSLPQPIDYPKMQAILSSQDTMEHLQFMHYGGWTKEMTQQRHDDYIESMKKKSTLTFLVYFNQDNQVIGDTGLYAIDLTNKTAGMGRIIDHHYHGYGVGTEIMYLLFKHAFEVMGLHRIFNKTSPNNMGVHKIEDMIGVSEAYREREILFHNGQYEDLCVYEHFDRDWPSIKQKLETRIANKDAQNKSKISASK